ncbi:MAG: DNA polymerase I [Candidatus Omnitrophica bacterium]|nr:DNA polymerase I [Candidatus Omnitrophota bacterium]
MKKERAFLIDGNSFCYRAFYAIRSLSTSTGRPTNAIYGFISMLQKLVAEETPEYLAASFDLKGETFRKKRYEAYKIHRKPMPEELVEQIPTIKTLLGLYRIPIFEKEGYEADDLLATVSKKLSEEGLTVYIVTGDKDILQLVSDDIFVYNTHQEGLIYDEKKVKERYGVQPERMVDLIGLCGDQSDNIPGVPGIGEKTAVELLQKFGTLEKVLSSADRMDNATRRKNLKEYASQARLSKELAKVDRDVPVEFSLETLRLQSPDREGLYALFKELEFRSLVSQFAPRQEANVHYRLIQTEEAFEHFQRKLTGVKRFAFDFETTSEDAFIAEPVGVSFSWAVGEAFYLSFGKRGLEASKVLKRLQGLFEDTSVEKVGQNIKYEMILLARNGIHLQGVFFDTMIASYLLNPSKPNHNLGEIALEYLDLKKTPITELIGKGVSQKSMAEVPLTQLVQYACEDSDVTFRLSRLLEKKLREKDLEGLFEKVELPLVDVLASMEQAGISIDAPYLKSLSEEMGKKLKKLTQQIHGMADCEFNLNSPKQLREILFKKLKLPILKRTKTGPSTDAWVLENLAPIHPLPQTMVQYRELSKLKSTYVDTLPELVNPKTHKVHTSFNQTVTATGRLSSSDPNLQNIPIRTEEGKRIRKAFVPRQKGWILVSFDYSQIELRVLTHLSKDETLREAFRKGEDIHRLTASLIYGVEEDEVDEAMRDTAKTVNFGIIYGMSAFGLSRDLGIDVTQARAFIDAYFERYPKVKSYIERQIETAKAVGYVSTLFNRRRTLSEIRSKNLSERQFGERIAVNAPIQGTASDLIKIAMIAIHRELKKQGAKTQMVVQVHDELLFDMPEEEDKEFTPMIVEKMEQVTKLSVPIKVTVKRGKNWLEMT